MFKHSQSDSSELWLLKDFGGTAQGSNLTALDERLSPNTIHYTTAVRVKFKVYCLLRFFKKVLLSGTSLLLSNNVQIISEKHSIR